MNTNVICHGNTLLALVESGCLPARLSSTLDTVEYTDLRGGLPRGFTAHPKSDPVSGELFAAVYSPLHSRAEYIVMPPAGTTRKIERIPLGGRPMMHDVALTENHVVLFDLPVRFDLRAAVHARFSWRWSDRHHARLGVLPKEGSAMNIRWFPTPPCFVFHSINANEPDGLIRVWALRYKKVFDGLTQDPFEIGTGVPWEWTIHLSSGQVTERQLDDRMQELPRIAPRRLGRPFRHFFSLSGGERSLATHEPEVLVKNVLKKDRSEEGKYPRGAVPTEPVFVPNEADEDSGWILHFLLDPLHQTSDLLVLDARTSQGHPSPRAAADACALQVPMHLDPRCRPRGRRRDAPQRSTNEGLRPPIRMG